MDIPRLHPDTIAAVKDRVDIVEVIGDYVVLKKRGKDYLGLCPFHDEKTPSFSVSPVKQMYYCFGCGAGGNAFKFLMELGKRSFSDVVLDLARRYQVSVQTLAPEEKQELQRQLSQREQLFEILAVASSFYHHALFQPQGKIALDYLHNQRRLSAETIKHFQLGYAPDGWETLYRYLIEQKRYPLAAVENAGLIKARQSGSGHYDQFRHRLMIPIRDDRGRAIAFGSRTLGQDEPKYLNSPETPLFHKGKTLFGLDQAKKAVQNADQAILVEGYFDVIALHQAGIKQAVAALGTALSITQIKSLMRFTESKEIVFNFDADKAGIKATQRAIQEIETLVTSGQVNLRILNLPSGKDADEFIQASPDNVQTYQSLVEQAPLWLDWQIQQLMQGKQLDQATHFEQVAQGMVKLLQRLGNHNKRSYYLQRCAEMLSQGDARFLPLHLNTLQNQLTIPTTANTTKASLPPSLSPVSSRLGPAESLLLKIYLHCPGYRANIFQLLEDKGLGFASSVYRQLWQAIAEVEDHFQLQTDPDNQLPALLQMCYLEQQWDTQPLEQLLRLSETTQADIYRPEASINQAIIALEKDSWEKYGHHCTEQLKTLDPRIQAQDFQYYQQEWMRARQAIQHLNATLVS